MAPANFGVASYLGVVYITKATQGFYVYGFLNPSHGAILGAYIVGILAASVLIFVIVNLIKLGLSKITGSKERNDWRERYEMRQRDNNLEKGKSGSSF